MQVPPILRNGLQRDTLLRRTDSRVGQVYSGQIRRTSLSLVQFGKNCAIRKCYDMNVKRLN